MDIKRASDFSEALMCGKQDLNSSEVIKAKKECSKMDNLVLYKEPH